MKQTKLTLGEIYTLNLELFGNENNKGLLSQPLPLKVKYWLQRLADKLKSEVATIDEIRNGLIKELGTEENGKVQIKTDSPNFEIFQKQYVELLDTEKEITHAVFTLDQFENLEAAEYYAIFLKLIDEEQP
jgi:hypothetical protein